MKIFWSHSHLILSMHFMLFRKWNKFCPIKAIIHSIIFSSIHCIFFFMRKEIVLAWWQVLLREWNHFQPIKSIIYGIILCTDRNFVTNYLQVVIIWSWKWISDLSCVSWNGVLLTFVNQLNYFYQCVYLFTISYLIFKVDE